MNSEIFMWILQLPVNIGCENFIFYTSMHFNAIDITVITQLSTVNTHTLVWDYSKKKFILFRDAFAVFQTAKTFFCPIQNRMERNYRKKCFMHTQLAKGKYKIVTRKSNLLTSWLTDWRNGIYILCVTCRHVILYRQ